MRKQLIMQLSSLLLVLVFLLIPGAYGVWLYHEDIFVITPPAPVTQRVNTSLKYDMWDDWTGDEALPNNVNGENHSRLIDNIINHPVAGMNAGSESLINQAIATRAWGVLGSNDELGSMDSGRWFTTDGPELEAALETNQGGEAEYLSYIVQWIDENNDDIIDYYYIYTTNIYLGEKGETWLGTINSKKGKPTIAIGEYIYEIYQTKVEWKQSKDTNGDGVTDAYAWTATQTVVGSAKSAWYTESSAFGVNPNPTQIPSFNVDTFVSKEERPMGTNFDNAIWVYGGYSNYTYTNSSSQRTYFKINATRYTEYTINITIAKTANPAVELEVYTTNNSNSKVAPQLKSILTETSTVTNSDGTQTTNTYYKYVYTYTPTKNGVHYFVPYGDVAMLVNIEGS